VPVIFFQGNCKISNKVEVKLTPVIEHVELCHFMEAEKLSFKEKCMDLSNEDSEALALKLGYEKIPDEKAYTGAYYIKEGKIWIFNIQGLKHERRVTSNEELIKQGYDVEMYIEISKNLSKYKSILTESDLISLYHDLSISDDDEDVYLEGGCYLTSKGTLRS